MRRSVGASTPRCYRLTPRLPPWDLPFLRGVAERMAVLPLGTALLVERSGEEDPILFPASPMASWAIEEAAGGVPGRLESREVAGLRRNGPGTGSAFGVLVPGKGADAPAGPQDPLDRPDGEEEDGATPEPLAALLPEEPTIGAVEPRPVGGVQFHLWSTGGPRLAVRVRLREPKGEGENDRLTIRAAGLRRAAGPTLSEARLLRFRGGWRSVRAWRRGSVPGLSKGPPFFLTPLETARLLRPHRPPPPLDEPTLARHVAVVGASGAGKSSFLVELAAHRIRSGRPVVLFDVHGDLGPAVAARWPKGMGDRLTAIDLTAPLPEIPGVALFAEGTGERRERECAHLVASLRHLSSEGGEVYWGSRLEQVFDVVVRLAAEEGGGFPAIFELLTDPARRDAARLSTRLPVAARFLDELPALLRRQPDYLQGAIARVQKLLLQPALLRLFTPSEVPIDIGAIASDGRSIAVRVPASEVGSSTSRFAVTLLASRAYLSIASRGPLGDRPSVLFVLDEAHSIAPTLLAEILSDGRKFGIAAIVATQYPGRLADDALAAAEGAAGTHLVFSVPRASAAVAGRWVGLPRRDAERLLPALPPGVGVLDGALGAPRRLVGCPAIDLSDRTAWRSALRATVEASGGVREDGPTVELDPADEAVLLALVGADARRPSASRIDLLEAFGPSVPPEERGWRFDRLIARGWIEEEGGRTSITPAGARRIGAGASTGATRESSEHRALLIEALRIFARHGERMEIVRQGRYDTRLPDGRVVVLKPASRLLPGDELGELVALRRTGWLWNAFGGRDVHVEAEVSGAIRPERVRRGLSKARAHRASVVFLVSSARKASRVRAVLRAEALRPREAQVWTLPAAAVGARQEDEPGSP